MIYGFNSEDVAFALKGIGEERLAGNGSDPAPTGKEVIFVKTPSAGIPARSGSTVEEADCSRVYLDEDLELQESDDQVVPVANTSESEIAGDTYVKAVMLGVNWVAVTGGGGGGGGDQMFQLQNSAEISAASGLTFGTGTASLLQINIGATAYEDAGEPAVTMINPFEEAVPSGAMITAYKKTHTFADDSTDDRYVIVQVSCPAETP